MILVTGATGTIGASVVRLLATGGRRVRAMTREPSKVSPTAGVEAVRGDFTDAASLAAAVAGVDTLFLLSAPGPGIADHDRAMLAAARAAETTAVVKVSAIGTGDRAGVGDWHLPGEQALRASGMAWTVLRPSSYASNALRWAPAIEAGDPVPNTTGTGAQGVIDPGDVAEVAVRALTSAEYHGQVLTLTGPELLSVPDMAERLGKVLSHDVSTVDVPLESYRERMLAAGLDPAFADAAVEGSRLVAGGGNAILTEDVRQVLGRAPRAFDDWAREHRGAFPV